MKITNHTRDPLDFIVKGKVKEGVPQTASVAPGDTADLDVDMNDAQLRGRILSGAVSVPSHMAEKVGEVQTGPIARGK